MTGHPKPPLSELFADRLLPDDVLFDSRFPGHPISRLRAILTMFEEAVSFRKDLYEYTAFPVLLAPSET